MIFVVILIIIFLKMLLFRLLGNHFPLYLYKFLQVSSKLKKFKDFYWFHKFNFIMQNYQYINRSPQFSSIFQFQLFNEIVFLFY